MSLLKTANQAITLAQAIRTYWDAELPKRHPNYPLVAPGEDSGPPPPEEGKLRKLLAGLAEDDLYRLLLISYVGQGVFGIDDLAGRYQTLKQEFSKPAWVIDQLVAKANLADYLADGLVELKKAGFDVDHLQLTPAKAAS